MRNSTRLVVCIGFMIAAGLLGVAAAGPLKVVNYSPWPDAAVASPGLRGQQTAANGEACGCKADQACCEKVCCASTHPHHCANTKGCYRTLSEAQAACGSAVEVCGVPQ